MRLSNNTTSPRSVVHCLECGDVVHIDTGDYYIYEPRYCVRCEDERVNIIRCRDCGTILPDAPHLYEPRYCVRCENERINIDADELSRHDALMGGGDEV